MKKSQLLKALRKAVPHDLPDELQVAWDKHTTTVDTKDHHGEEKHPDDLHDEIKWRFRHHPEVKKAHHEAFEHHVRHHVDWANKRKQAAERMVELDTIDHDANERFHKMDRLASNHYSQSRRHHQLAGTGQHYWDDYAEVEHKHQQHLQPRHKKAEHVPHKHDQLLESDLHKALPEHLPEGHQMNWETANMHAKPSSGQSVSHDDVIQEFRKNPEVKQAHHDAFKYHVEQAAHHDRHTSLTSFGLTQEEQHKKWDAHGDASNKHHSAAKRHYLARENIGHEYPDTREFSWKPTWHKKGLEDHLRNFDDEWRTHAAAMTHEHHKPAKFKSHKHDQLLHHDSHPYAKHPDKDNSHDIAEEAHKRFKKSMAHTPTSDYVGGLGADAGAGLLADGGEEHIRIPVNHERKKDIDAYNSLIEERKARDRAYKRKQKLGKALPQDLEPEGAVKWDQAAEKAKPSHGKQQQHHDVVKEFRKDPDVQAAHEDAFHHHMKKWVRHRKRMRQQEGGSGDDNWVHHDKQARKHYWRAVHHWTAQQGHALRLGLRSHLDNEGDEDRKARHNEITPHTHRIYADVPGPRSGMAHKNEKYTEDHPADKMLHHRSTDEHSWLADPVAFTPDLTKP